MSYRVVLTPNARQELYEDALWWAEHRDADQAARWLDGFERTLEGLAQNPVSHPLLLDLANLPQARSILPYRPIQFSGSTSVTTAISAGLGWG